MWQIVSHTEGEFLLGWNGTSGTLLTSPEEHLCMTYNNQPFLASLSEPILQPYYNPYYNPYNHSQIQLFTQYLILFQNNPKHLFSHYYLFIPQYNILCPAIMQRRPELRRNEKFETLRGKIKISLPALSPEKRKCVSLGCSLEKNMDDGVHSPKAPIVVKELMEPFNITEQFYLKNVFEEKYEILDRLGEGANGIVRKCRNRDTGEILAVKIGRMEEEHIIALKMIVEMMRKIKHSNILKMRELYVDAKRSKYYQVIEYLPYPSLKHLISHGFKFISSNIEKIMKQLLEGLNYFHSQHIVHRDIKTSNLLYDTENERLYIIDLGLITKTVRRGKRRNLWTNTGTLEYKAPETLEGSTYNEAVDMWAAGVVLYELIEGRTPFRQQSQMDIIQNIRSIKYKFSPELWVDIPLAKLLVTRLLKPKHQRLTASAALKDPWFQLMNFDYKPPKAESPIKKPTINLTASPYNFTGFLLSGAAKRKPLNEDEDELLHGLSEQSKEYLRMTTCEPSLKNKPGSVMSADDLDKILGKETEKDIINNN